MLASGTVFPADCVRRTPQHGWGVAPGVLTLQFWDFIRKQTMQLPTSSSFLRKEVIQPHLPIRLPCYDFTPVIGPAFGGSLLEGWVTDFGRFRLPWCDGRCVQDPGTHSPRRSDSRLLAIPASRSRVADCDPNWDVVFGIRSGSLPRLPLFTPL